MIESVRWNGEPPADETFDGRSYETTGLQAMFHQYSNGITSPKRVIWGPEIIIELTPPGQADVFRLPGNGQNTYLQHARQIASKGDAYVFDGGLPDALEQLRGRDFRIWDENWDVHLLANGEITGQGHGVRNATLDEVMKFAE
ncbi:MAG: hypothetical protein ABH879_02330 [archaeon]